MEHLTQKHFGFINKWRKQGFNVEYVRGFNSNTGAFIGILACQKAANGHIIRKIFGPTQNVEILDKTIQLYMIQRYNHVINRHIINLTKSNKLDEKIVEEIIQSQLS